MAYATLNKVDVLAAARPIVSGYHAEYPLTEAELELLFPLIAIRLATSVTMSAHQQKLEPDNDYLRISETPAWAALQKLADVPPALAHFTFRAACGLPPNPKSAAVVQWLTQQPAAPLVEPPLTPENVHILDLSVGSLDIPNLEILADTAAFSRSVFGQIAAAGAQVGIGRYNEARLVYTAPQFTVESDELPESRTIHLGLDLFLPAGAPVFAPLDGIVYSLQNNATPKDYGPTLILQHQTGSGDLFYTLYGHLSEDSLGRTGRGRYRSAAVNTSPTSATSPPTATGRRICTFKSSPICSTPLFHWERQRSWGREGANFPGVAAPNQRDVWRSISPDPNLLLRIPAECFPPEPPASQRNTGATARKNRPIVEHLLQPASHHCARLSSISVRCRRAGLIWTQ